MIIKLNSYELMQAAQVGVMRRIASLEKKLNKDNHTTGVSNWATDIEGAAAELAYAKAAGVYWGGHVNSFKDPDVGQYQIRSTTHEQGKLIVRPNDKADEIYILITCNAPFYHIRGWMSGNDAKQDHYFMPGHYGAADAWWVPQSDLKEIDLLF